MCGKFVPFVFVSIGSRQKPKKKAVCKPFYIRLIFEKLISTGLANAYIYLFSFKKTKPPLFLILFIFGRNPLSYFNSVLFLFSLVLFMIPSSIFILLICLVLFLSWLKWSLFFVLAIFAKSGFQRRRIWIFFFRPSLFKPFFPYSNFFCSFCMVEKRTSFVFLHCKLQLFECHAISWNAESEERKKRKQKIRKKKEKKEATYHPQLNLFLLYLLCVKKRP